MLYLILGNVNDQAVLDYIGIVDCKSSSVMPHLKKCAGQAPDGRDTILDAAHNESDALLLLEWMDEMTGVSMSYLVPPAFALTYDDMRGNSHILIASPVNVTQLG